MKRTKITALLLACIMLATCFVGCGKSANYGTINGEKIDSDVFEALVTNMLAMYSSYGYDETQMKDLLKQDMGDGTTVGESIKSICLESVKQEIATTMLAKEHDISLNDEDKASLEKTKQTNIDSTGGRAGFVEALKEQGLTEEDYDHNQEYYMLQQKMFNALFNKGGLFAPTEDEVVSSVLSDNIRVRHVVILAKESDADYAEKKAKAESVLVRAKAGEDFDALINEFGEDPGMTTYPDGYVFNSQGVLADDGTNFDPNFTAASFKLDVNGISDLVTSTSGIHIIKRLPLDEAFVRSKLDTYYTTYSEQAFTAKLMEVMENLDVKTTEEYDNLDMSSFIVSHEGHNH